MKSIKYKNITYIMDENYWKGDTLNNTSEFQHQQLLYCVKIKDWNTLQNRIFNMLKWGGIKKL